CWCHLRNFTMVALVRLRKLPGFYLPNRHPAFMQPALIAMVLIVNIISVPCEKLGRHGRVSFWKKAGN
ncbi:MAG: hypothetical protein JZU64_11275, partial [Rhodoferax sp.]|nr:hypothetical protein [Rhodoferax sp.]